MDVREKLVELLGRCAAEESITIEPVAESRLVDFLVNHGVTVQEYGEWVHTKGYVVSNGFLCSKCGHEEASHYPINPRPGGAYIADDNGNFFYPPKLNYCPNCGAKMMPHPPKGE